MSIEELVLFSYGARIIWYNRNLLSHGKRGLYMEEACLSTKALADHFNKPSFRFTISEWEGGRKWEAPKQPFIKYNSDGAWKESTKEVGFSVVCRDEEGLILGTIAGPIPDLQSAKEAEGVAVFKAMYWAEKEGTVHYIFRMDNAEVFSTVPLRNCSYTQLPDWAQKCLALLSNKETWRLTLINREGNSTADKLAKMACYKGWSWRRADCLPMPRLTGMFP